jgi:hypothetical protein
MAHNQTSKLAGLLNKYPDLKELQEGKKWEPYGTLGVWSDGVHIKIKTEISASGKEYPWRLLTNAYTKAMHGSKELFVPEAAMPPGLKAAIDGLNPKKKQFYASVLELHKKEMQAIGMGMDPLKVQDMINAGQDPTLGMQGKQVDPNLQAQALQAAQAGKAPEQAAQPAQAPAQEQPAQQAPPAEQPPEQEPEQAQAPAQEPEQAQAPEQPAPEQQPEQPVAAPQGGAPPAQEPEKEPEEEEPEAPSETINTTSPEDAAEILKKEDPLSDMDAEPSSEDEDESDKLDSSDVYFDPDSGEAKAPGEEQAKAPEEEEPEETGGDFYYDPETGEAKSPGQEPEATQAAEPAPQEPQAPTEPEPYDQATKKDLNKFTLDMVNFLKYQGGLPEDAGIMAFFEKINNDPLLRDHMTKKYGEEFMNTYIMDAANWVIDKLMLDGKGNVTADEIMTKTFGKYWPSHIYSAGNGEKIKDVDIQPDPDASPEEPPKTILNPADLPDAYTDTSDLDSFENALVGAASQAHYGHSQAEILKKLANDGQLQKELDAHYGKGFALKFLSDSAHEWLKYKQTVSDSPEELDHEMKVFYGDNWKDIVSHHHNQAIIDLGAKKEVDPPDIYQDNENSQEVIKFGEEALKWLISKGLLPDNASNVDFFKALDSNDEVRKEINKQYGAVFCVQLLSDSAYSHYKDLKASNYESPQDAKEGMTELFGEGWHDLITINHYDFQSLDKEPNVSPQWAEVMHKPGLLGAPAHYNYDLSDLETFSTLLGAWLTKNNVGDVDASDPLAVVKALDNNLAVADKINSAYGTEFTKKYMSDVIYNTYKNMTSDGELGAKPIFDFMKSNFGDDWHKIISSNHPHFQESEKGKSFEWKKLLHGLDAPAMYNTVTSSGITQFRMKLRAWLTKMGYLKAYSNTQEFVNKLMSDKELVKNLEDIYGDGFVAQILSDSVYHSAMFHKGQNPDVTDAVLKNNIEAGYGPKAVQLLNIYHSGFFKDYKDTLPDNESSVFMDPSQVKVTDTPKDLEIPAKVDPDAKKLTDFKDINFSELPDKDALQDPSKPGYGSSVSHLALALTKQLNLATNGPLDMVKALKKEPNLVKALEEKYGANWFNKLYDYVLVKAVNNELNQVNSNNLQNITDKLPGHAKALESVFGPKWKEAFSLLAGGASLGSQGPDGKGAPVAPVSDPNQLPPAKPNPPEPAPTATPLTVVPLSQSINPPKADPGIAQIPTSTPAEPEAAKAISELSKKAAVLKFVDDLVASEGKPIEQLVKLPVQTHKILKALGVGWYDIYKTAKAEQQAAGKAHPTSQLVTPVAVAPANPDPVGDGKYTPPVVSVIPGAAAQGSEQDQIEKIVSTVDYQMVQHGVSDPVMLPAEAKNHLNSEYGTEWLAKYQAKKGSVAHVPAQNPDSVAAGAQAALNANTLVNDVDAKIQHLLNLYGDNSFMGVTGADWENLSAFQSITDKHGAGWYKKYQNNKLAASFQEFLDKDSHVGYDPQDMVKSIDWILDKLKINNPDILEADPDYNSYLKQNYGQGWKTKYHETKNPSPAAPPTSPSTIATPAAQPPAPQKLNPPDVLKGFANILYHHGQWDEPIPQDKMQAFEAAVKLFGDMGLKVPQLDGDGKLIGGKFWYIPDGTGYGKYAMAKSLKTALATLGHYEKMKINPLEHLAKDKSFKTAMAKAFTTHWKSNFVKMTGDSTGQETIKQQNEFMSGYQGELDPGSQSQSSQYGAQQSSSTAAPYLAHDNYQVQSFLGNISNQIPSAFSSMSEIVDWAKGQLKNNYQFSSKLNGKPDNELTQFAVKAIKSNQKFNSKLQVMYGDQWQGILDAITGGAAATPVSDAQVAGGHAFPSSSEFTIIGDAGDMGGSKAKFRVEDNLGNKYLFKPSHGGLFPALAANAASNIQQQVIGVLDGKSVTPVAFINLKGKGFGSVQPIHALKMKNGKAVTIKDLGGLENLTKEQIRQLQRECLVDWLVSNHDSFNDNIVFDLDGNVIGIDKDQAFKHIGEDEEKLDTEYKPPENGAPPVYHELYKKFADSKIDLDPNDMLPYLEAISKISDADYEKMVKRYIINKAGAPEGSYEYNNLLKKVLERKNNIRDDFEKFFTDLLHKRGELSPGEEFCFISETAQKKASGIPYAQDLQPMPNAPKLQAGGAKKVYQDKDGNPWVHSVALVDDSGTPEAPQTAYVQEGYSKIANLIDPDAPKVGVTIIEGNMGVLHPLYLDSEGKPAPTLQGVDPATLSEELALDVASHHLLDWVGSQHGSTADKFIVVDDKIISVGKSEGFKHFEKPGYTGGFDQLSFEYVPPGGPTPLYNDFWKSWTVGDVDLDPKLLADKAYAIKNIPDNKYKAAYDSYVKAMYPNSVSKQNEMMEKILARKNNVVHDFEEFLTELHKVKTGEDGQFTFSYGWVPDTSGTTVVHNTLTAKDALNTPEFSELSVINVVNSPPPGAPGAPQITPAGYYVKSFVGKPELSAIKIPYAQKQILQDMLKDLGVTPDQIVDIPGQMNFVAGVNTEKLKNVLGSHYNGDFKEAFDAFRTAELIKKQPKPKTATTPAAPPEPMVAIRIPTYQNKSTLTKFLSKFGLPVVVPATDGNYYTVKVPKSLFDAAKVTTTLKMSTGFEPPKQSETPQGFPKIILPKAQKPNFEELSSIHTATLGRAGKAILLDGDLVEGQSARIFRYTDKNGKAFYRMTFKLRMDEGKKHLKNGVSSSIKLHQFKYIEGMDASKPTHWGPHEGWIDNPASMEFKSEHGTMHVINNTSDYAYHGLTVIDVPDTGGSPKDAIRGVLEKADPALASTVMKNPTQQDLEYMKVRRTCQAFCWEEFKSLPASQHTIENYKSMLLTKGITDQQLQTVSAIESVPGHITHAMPGRYKKLAGNLRYMFTNTYREEVIVPALKFGMLSINERGLSGLQVKGASVSGDIDSGSADGILFRPATDDLIENRSAFKDTYGNISFLLSPQAMDRLDAYVHIGDHWGAISPSDNRTATIKSAEKQFQEMHDSGYYSGGAEVSFRKGINKSQIMRVMTNDNEIRKRLIQKCLVAGITEVNGCPIEEFVVVCTSPKKAYEDYIKPMGF